jgi:2-iminobutanoate/2-iminopropanoate deaminase
MHPIETRTAPTAGGHYSQAIVHNGMVFVSGQLPFDPARGRDTPLGTIEEQTVQTLKNVEAILVAAGSDMQHVLSLTVYVSDMDSWGTVNTVCARVFGAHRPSRAIVPVRISTTASASRFRQSGQ